MTPFSRYSEQQQRDLQEFADSPRNFAPPLSRLVVTELGDYLVQNDYEETPGCDDRAERNTDRSNGVLSRLTHVFDRSPQSNSVSPVSRVASSKTKNSLYLAIKKSLPNLRRSSNRQQFEQIPDVPRPIVMPQSGDYGDDGAQPWSPSPMAVGNLHIPRTRAIKPTARVPKSAASTVARVEFSVGARKPEAAGMVETWLSVIVRANVNHFEEAVISNVPPSALDVLILVDNSEESSAEFVEAALQKAINLATTLDVLTDGLVVGCVSSDPNRNLEVSVPMKSRNEHIIRQAFNSLPSLHFPQVQVDGTRLCDALKEGASYVLTLSNREALRHIFLLTPQAQVAIADDGYNHELLRLHTISVRPSVEILNSKAFYGWHVQSDFALANAAENADEFKERMKKIVRYLRLGVDPGVLTGLSAHFEASNGTKIVENDVTGIKCKRLRPGESLHTTVQLSTDCFASQKASMNVEGCIGADEQELDVDEIVNDLRGMLNLGNINSDSTVKATVKYGLSVLPKDTVMKTTVRADLSAIPFTGFIPNNGGIKVENSEVYEDDSDGEGGFRSSNETNRHSVSMNATIGRNFSRPLDNEDISQSQEYLNPWYNAVRPAIPPRSPAREFPPRMDPVDGRNFGSLNPFRNLVAKNDHGFEYGLE